MHNYLWLNKKKIRISAILIVIGKNLLFKPSLKACQKTKKWSVFLFFQILWKSRHYILLTSLIRTCQFFTLLFSFFRSLCNNRRSRASTVASDATEETSRLLMTEECEGSLENGYAKLKWNKNKVKTESFFGPFFLFFY